MRKNGTWSRTGQLFASRLGFRISDIGTRRPVALAGGSLGGMLGSMNPMNLMPFGSKKEEKEASEDKAGLLVLNAFAFSLCYSLS